jgi:phosphoribosyl-ATP pyrophosphohydrolase
MAEDNVLEQLYQVILSRRGADPTQSNTARLFAKGKKKIAQKLGEEAVETLIEGVKGDKDGVVSESADLLYHLLVLWAALAALDVKPDEVWAALRAREGISGIAEKASRPKD